MPPKPRMALHGVWFVYTVRARMRTFGHRYGPPAQVVEYSSTSALSSA